MRQRLCDGPCKQIKDVSAYWKCKACRGGIDYWCSDCKRKKKLKTARTPWGLYSARARILSTYVSHFRKGEIGDKPRGEFQLDHRYSIRAGFDNGVPIEIISQPGNLEWLPTRINRGKGSACSITLETLNGLGGVDEAMRRIAGALNEIDDADRLLQLSIASHANYKTEKGENDKLR